MDDQTWLIVLIIFIVSGIFGYLSLVIAENKDRESKSWFFLGFFSWIFGPIVAGIVPPYKKSCPKCGELSSYGMRICTHCSYEFMGKEQVK
ncbi:MAG: hypothetical protein P4L49_01565 [Desulfosporosinus sp.]|nr:hypothetical protein [Desulfosporosinus sp.]